MSREPKTRHSSSLFGCRDAVSGDERRLGNYFTHRTPDHSRIRNRAINQTSQLLTHRWGTHVQTRRGLLPVVRGGAEDTSHRQRALENRFVTLETRYRRDGIPGDLAMVAEIEDPGDP